MRALVPRERIEQTILVIRGHRVMLDADLAELYGVETKAFNRAVTTNMERFPDDFMFRLTKKEYEDLRYHFGTSRWGGRRYLPYAFHRTGCRDAVQCPSLGAPSALRPGDELVYIHECLYVGHPEGDRQLRKAWRPV